VKLTGESDGSAGDQYAGPDRFGEVVDDQRRDGRGPVRFRVALGQVLPRVQAIRPSVPSLRAAARKEMRWIPELAVPPAPEFWRRGPRTPGGPPR